MSLVVPPSAPSAAPLAVQFGELAALLDTVIGAVQAGDSVDLAGLDRRADELCQAARQLSSPGEVKPVAEAMMQVIERLDRLQSVLPNPRAGEHADAQRAAAAAYGRAVPTKR